MECGDSQTFCAFPCQQFTGSRFHFAGGFIGKGNRGNMPWLDATLLYQVSYLASDNTGFATTSASQYQQGAIDVLHGSFLLGVELSQEDFCRVMSDIEKQAGDSSRLLLMSQVAGWKNVGKKCRARLSSGPELFKSLEAGVHYFDPGIGIEKTVSPRVPLFRQALCLHFFKARAACFHLAYFSGCAQ